MLSQPGATLSCCTAQQEKAMDTLWWNFTSIYQPNKFHNMFTPITIMCHYGLGLILGKCLNEESTVCSIYYNNKTETQALNIQGWLNIITLWVGTKNASPFNLPWIKKSIRVLVLQIRPLISSYRQSTLFCNLVFTSFRFIMIPSFPHYEFWISELILGIPVNRNIHWNTEITLYLLQQ